MERAEFLEQFNLYYNNISSNQAPGLDPYEVSVFLTHAQENVVLGLYNGNNPASKSFEQTEELRRYLANLIVDTELEPLTNSSGQLLGVEGSNSYFFSLPDGTGEDPAVWFITYESVTVTNNKCGGTSSIEVYPVRQDEYQKIKKNPFRGANDRRALRLDLSDNNVEIVSSMPVTKYHIKYFRKPNPIILENLEDGLTIDGKDTATDCELHEALHKSILEGAVALAVQNWNRQ